MPQLHAQPYDITANGFYFESLEDYADKAKSNRNDYGDPVEEYEIQFIDGDHMPLHMGRERPPAARRDDLGLLAVFHPAFARGTAPVGRLGLVRVPFDVCPEDFRELAAMGTRDFKDSLVRLLIGPQNPAGLGVNGRGGQHDPAIAEGHGAAHGEFHRVALLRTIQQRKSRIIWPHTWTTTISLWSSNSARDRNSLVRLRVRTTG